MKKAEKFKALVDAGLLPEKSVEKKFTAEVVNSLYSFLDKVSVKDVDLSKKCDTAKKTLDVTNLENSKEKVSDIVLVGVSRNQWRLICKVYSKKEGWMKSTKGLQTGMGVALQVTTQDNGEVAEALTFIPGAKLAQDKENDCWYIV